LLHKSFPSQTAGFIDQYCPHDLSFIPDILIRLDSTFWLGPQLWGQNLGLNLRFGLGL